MKGWQSWEIQPPLFPSFLRAPSSCDMHTVGGGSLRTGALWTACGECERAKQDGGCFHQFYLCILLFRFGRKSWENPLCPPTPTIYAWKKHMCWEKSQSTRLTLSMMVAPCMWLWHKRQKLDHTYSVSSPGRANSREKRLLCLGSHYALCCTGTSTGLSTLPASAKQCTSYCQLFFYYLAFPDEALLIWINFCSKFTGVVLVFLHSRSN